MRFFRLKRDQKEAIGLLQIGTFLEYFDLMIYVHMAVVLNQLFFPPSDPKTAAILTAFSFCSTYFLRPFGALIFGYIGDNFGRKPTVIITTSIMAGCCIIMANLPTYAEIGITAAVIVSILRIMQGMSSMGEVMGARIYLTEITRPPAQYPVVCFISIAAAAGTMAALGVSTLATRAGFNWRLAFWFGVVIALVGVAARTRLREAPEYADAKTKMKRALERASEDGLTKPAQLLKSTSNVFKKKSEHKNFIHFFVMFCTWPFVFYLAYMYFIPTLKSNCGYSSEDVIFHNLLLSIVQICIVSIYAFLSYKISPLFLAKMSGIAFIILMALLPILLSGNYSQYTVFIFQAALLSTAYTEPLDPILIKHFPILRRFTSVTFGYALSRALMYVIISFGLVFLTEWFGFYGIWVIAVPLIFFWFKSLFHFEKLEKETGGFPLAYPFNETKQQKQNRFSAESL